MNRSLPKKLRMAVLPRFLVVAIVSIASGAAGCTAGESTPVVQPELQQFRDVGLDQDAAELVPEEIKTAGELVVPTAATYPPNEFLAPDGKKIIGMDPDLAIAIGQRLGLDVKMVAIDFDSVIPTVADGSRLMSLSSITITPERAEQVDMVAYYEAGTGFFTTNDEPDQLSGLSGLCGQTVAVAGGTVQQRDASRQSRKCAAAGDPTIDVTVAADQAEATKLVESKKSDYGMADSPVAAYIVKKSEGNLLKVGGDYGIAPYGVAVNRKSGLAVAVAAAVNSLIKDGSYEEILARWGLEGGAVSKAVVEP